MDLTKIIPLIFGAIGIFGGLSIFYNRAAKEALINTVTQDNLAKDSYIKTLEADKERLIAERDGYKRQYEDLKDLAQGSPQLKVLSNEFNKLTKAITRQSDAFTKYIKGQNK